MFAYWNNSYYLVIILQVLAIIHAFKTGRREWLYILLFLPVVGLLVYFFMELLPAIRSGDFFSNFRRIFLPAQQIREWERKVRISDTVSNRVQLSQAYADQRQYAKAIELTLGCLNGMYANDAGILLQLARQYFMNGQYRESLQIFDKLKTLKTGRINMAEDDLMYVRAQEGVGDLANAEEGYKQIIRVHHSLEARYYYGLFLKKQSRGQEAKAQFQAVREDMKLLPRYAKRLNATWARKSLKELMST
ncbi:hypothetical protein GA0116948_10743 [Chitinophaga costaii]|uniref:Cardiolipin synthase N-terminal domain-containing protein n=1 Tax=Chitinophaga costaii TaxID=1335309 RepID=A0A1C4E230_9BACT|nr:hypothetical protein [Chitinophaga costaii]PUZ24362.1 hypothetical protein DCM91_13115 [Chitinophaga costaii]SCC37687.1 hypothetical protein GA0116948_10743 [Chitinophaga costaii]